MDDVTGGVLPVSPPPQAASDNAMAQAIASCGDFVPVPVREGAGAGSGLMARIATASW